jgi:hypothetical protein
MKSSKILINFKKVDSEFSLMNSLYIFINFLRFMLSQKLYVWIIHRFLFLFIMTFPLNIWSINWFNWLNSIPMSFFFMSKISFNKCLIIFYFFNQLPVIVFNFLESFLLLLVDDSLIDSIIYILFEFFLLFSLKFINNFDFLIEFL